MSIALLIFDCDGVLIDSELIACRVIAGCLTEAGFPIDTDGVRRRFVGRSEASMLVELSAEHGKSVPAGFAEARRHALEAAFHDELTAIPGIAAALDALPQRRCVASSSTPERIAFSLRLTGLYDRFAPNLYSAAMVARGKPAPDLFLFAARSLGVAPADCVVVEDSLFGVQAGRAAGMEVVGFVGGSHCDPGHAADLTAAGASIVIDHMDDLPAAIARLDRARRREAVGRSGE